MLNTYIEQLKPEVLRLFSNDSSGHDITHLERTLNLALSIQKQEGGDKIIIGISAFLHDVHRIMQNETGKFVSPKDSLGKVKKILSVTNLTEKQISQILYCIEHHEIYNWNNSQNNENDINTLILQDADNLDAIGAIGVARSFSYGGANKIIMYNNSISLEMLNDYSEENGNDESTIHHFYHKLFKLGEYMNTNTARTLAKARTHFMKEFVNEFLAEWNGEK
jgi:Predicted HD superfamily hydrolase